MDILNENMKRAILKCELIGFKPYYIGDFYFCTDSGDEKELHLFFSDGSSVIKKYEYIRCSRYFAGCIFATQTSIFVKDIRQSLKTKYGLLYWSPPITENSKVVIAKRHKDGMCLINYKGECIEIQGEKDKKFGKFGIRYDKDKKLYILSYFDNAITGLGAHIIEIDDEFSNINLVAPGWCIRRLEK